MPVCCFTIFHHGAYYFAIRAVKEVRKQVARSIWPNVLGGLP